MCDGKGLIFASSTACMRSSRASSSGHSPTELGREEVRLRAANSENTSALETREENKSKRTKTARKVREGGGGGGYREKAMGRLHGKGKGLRMIYGEKRSGNEWRQRFTSSGGRTLAFFRECGRPAGNGSLAAASLERRPPLPRHAKSLPAPARGLRVRRKRKAARKHIARLPRPNFRRPRVSTPFVY